MQPPWACRRAALHPPPPTRDRNHIGRNPAPTEREFRALLALIGFGIVLIFINIPGGALIYSVLGLVIFAGYTMFDFQRLRRSQNAASAPFLAASIFLDILNVFLFFLAIFSGDSGR